MNKINAEEDAPIAYADILQEYSTSLHKIDKIEKAEELLERANSIREEKPAGYSITDRTPYGTECE